MTTPPFRPADDDRALKLYGPPPKPRARKTEGPVPGLVRLSDVKSRPVRWLWPGWLPLGALVMIDGDPGVGKSTVTHDFAARVTAGGRWPDGQKCPRGNVLIMTAEEGLADTVLPRLEFAGGDPARAVVLTEVHTADGARLPALPLDIPFIESVIRAERIKLMTIDVLASYLGGEGKVNSHQDTDVRRALYPLFRMAERTSSCVLMLRHLNKQGAVANAMYRGGGSIGISGQARAVHLAAYDPDDPTQTRRILAPVKVNNAARPRALAYRIEAEHPGPGAPTRIAWAGEDRHTAADLLALAEDADARDDRDHTVAWIQDYLINQAGCEAPYAQLQVAARQAGIPERTLRNARRRAAVSYRRAGWQSGTVWVLDSETAAALKAERDGIEELPYDGASEPIEAIAASPSDAAPMASMDDSVPWLTWGPA